ncbi:MAG: DUF3256 family protein [Clostridium sp.]|nr:DUF3256 family protein [Clostridium sp.]
MKKIGCICLLLCLMQDVCARKMREVFADMPDSVLVMLTRNNRLDCIDFIENNMPARVRNLFDNYSELTALTDDYLSMALTSSSRVDMKLLPLGDSVQVVCLIRTYDGPVPESMVTFYDADWNKLDAGAYLKQPAFEDFWQKPDSLDEAEYRRLQHSMDLRCVTAVPEMAETVLTFILQTGDLTEEGRKSVAPCLRVLRYRWCGEEGFLPESPDTRH